MVFPIYLAYRWWTAAIALGGVAAIALSVLLAPIVAGLFALTRLGETAGLLSGPAWRSRPSALPRAGDGSHGARRDHRASEATNHPVLRFVARPNAV